MLNLFDLTSTSFTSNAFLLERQVTVAAIGLPAGGEIQFETVYFRDTPDGNVNIDCAACADACGPGSFPTSTMAVIGTKRLSCGPCELADPCECPADEALRIAKYNVKLTSTSSYIVLDAPIGSYIRAVYIGTGLGTFHAFYSNSDTRDLTDTMRGCCPPTDSSCNSKENQMPAAPIQVNLSDTLTAIPTPTACQSNFGTTVTGKLVQFVPGFGWFQPGQDGSETKVTAGAGVTVTGTGTIATPYVVSVPPIPPIAISRVYPDNTAVGNPAVLAEAYVAPRAGRVLVSAGLGGTSAGSIDSFVAVTIARTPDTAAAGTPGGPVAVVEAQSLSAIAAAGLGMFAHASVGLDVAVGDIISIVNGWNATQTGVYNRVASIDYLN